MEEKKKTDIEIWKKILIENLENKYEVSNFGNIRNTKTKKILKQYLLKIFYQKICKKQYQIIKNKSKIKLDNKIRHCCFHRK